MSRLDPVFFIKRGDAEEQIKQERWNSLSLDD